MATVIRQRYGDRLSEGDPEEKGANALVQASEDMRVFRVGHDDSLFSLLP